MYAPEDVDYLMETKVSRTVSGMVCMLCGITIKSQLKRHFMNRHVAGASYRCPACENKLFPNRHAFTNHVYRNHKEWRGMNFDDFLAE